LPGVIVALAGLIVILVEAVKPGSKSVFWITAISVAAALVAAIFQLGNPLTTAFSDMIVTGGMVAFGAIVILVGTFFSVLVSKDYLESIGHDYSEVYALILFATTGMLCLAASNNLITLLLD
jgi:NADH:ubiquinone oxidoreductase subunit 2 (chain N)